MEVTNNLGTVKIVMLKGEKGDTGGADLTQAVGTLDIAHGGTGAATAADALTSLGAASARDTYTAQATADAAQTAANAAMTRASAIATDDSAGQVIVGDYLQADATGRITVDVIEQDEISKVVFGPLPIGNRVLDLMGLNVFWAIIKNLFADATHYHSASDINSGTLPISRGGTGAATAADALAALGAQASGLIGYVDSNVNITNGTAIASQTGVNCPVTLPSGAVPIGVVALASTVPDSYLTYTLVHSGNTDYVRVINRGTTSITCGGGGVRVWYVNTGKL